MTDGELLAYMGDDAAKWAAEFCKIARDLGHDIDEGWMIGWFANAIEYSSHIRKIDAFAARAVADREGHQTPCLSALASGDACQPDESLKRCAICGFESR
jgi:hypothetical protein